MTKGTHRAGHNYAKSSNNKCEHLLIYFQHHFSTIITVEELLSLKGTDLEANSYSYCFKC